MRVCARLQTWLRLEQSGGFDADVNSGSSAGFVGEHQGLRLELLAQYSFRDDLAELGGRATFAGNHFSLGSQVICAV